MRDWTCYLGSGPFLVGRNESVFAFVPHNHAQVTPRAVFFVTFWRHSRALNLFRDVLAEVGMNTGDLLPPELHEELEEGYRRHHGRTGWLYWKYMSGTDPWSLVFIVLFVLAAGALVWIAMFVVGLGR